MLPIVDKPAIQFAVEEAVRAGIRDILMITGRGKRALEDHFDRSFELEHYLEARGKHDELAEMRRIADMGDIHFVRQGEPLGLGHAVSVAREHVGNSPFAVMLPDDVMHDESRLLIDMLKLHEETGHSVIALQEVPETRPSCTAACGPPRSTARSSASATSSRSRARRGPVQPRRPRR